MESIMAADSPSKRERIAAKDTAPRQLERKQAAEKIATCKKLRQSVTNPATLAALDAEIQAARIIANSGKPSMESIQEAAKTLAEAQLKLERASAHLEKAKDLETKASEEVQSAQAEFDRLRAPPRKPQQQDNALQQMANTLAQLSSAAQYTAEGKAIVDPSILQGLCDQLQGIALPRLGATPVPAGRRPEHLYQTTLGGPVRVAEESHTDMDAEEPTHFDSAVETSAVEDSFSELDATDLRSRLRAWSQPARKMTQHPIGRSNSSTTMVRRKITGKKSSSAYPAQKVSLSTIISTPEHTTQAWSE